MARAQRQQETSKEAGADWEEIPSTATIRWWIPGEDDESAIVCQIVERQTRETKYGGRGYYKVIAQAPAFDESDKGPIEPGTELIIWESAGLRDLAQFVGRVVKIVPAGKLGRTYVYRFMVPPGSKRS